MSTDDAPDTGLNDALARTIEGERVAQRMTREELATNSGIPVRTLQRYLLSQRHIPVVALEQLSRALRATAHALVERAESRLSEQPPRDVL